MRTIITQPVFKPLRLAFLCTLLAAADQKLTASIGTTPTESYWNGPGERIGAWETPANWLPTALPTKTAYLNNMGTISLTSAQSLDSFIIGSVPPFDGTLLLYSGGNLTARQIVIGTKDTGGGLWFQGGTVTTPRIVFGGGSSSLLFGQAEALTLNSVISGPSARNHGVNKDGPGTTTFTANNTYTGVTAVYNGRLQVNGAHTGGKAYWVAYTGVLGGIGTISAGVTVAAGAAGGTVAPGLAGSIGELSIGSLTLKPSGAVEIAVTNNATSLLRVTGAANLNGKLTFTSLARPTGALYPLLTAGTTLSGIFTSINNLPDGYEVFYGDNNTVFLKRSAAPPFSAAALLSSGESLITGGSLPFDVAVVNSGSASLSFTATNGTSTTGSVGSTTVNGGDSTNAAGLSFNGTTVGANQSGTFSVTSGGTTNNLTVSGISVYAHAAGSVVGGTNLGFAPVHVGYTSGGASTNSIAVSNAATNGAASLRANLGVTNNNTNFVSIVRDVAPGSTGLVTGTLASGLAVGQSNITVQLQFYDDSTLSGATNNLGTTNINLSYYVYSGQGVWTAGSGGNWTNISNWQVPGGVPGVDGALSTNDTAFFGTGGKGPVALNDNAQLRSITFDSSSAYVVSGSGQITLAAAGGTNAAINTLAGNHTISNRIVAGSELGISNAGGSTLALAGNTSGAGALNKTGSGSVTLSGSNSHTGGTLLNGGTMIFTSGSSFGTGTLTIGAAGTVLSNASANVVLPNNVVFSNFSGMFDLRLPNNSSLVLNGTISGGGPNVFWRFTGGESGQNTGALTLNGTNTFAGTLEVFRGPLILGNSQAAGTSLIVLDSNQNPNGSLQFSSSFTISNNIQTKTATEPIGVAAGRSNGLAGVVSGTGGINKVGAGTLYLLANNTYSGSTLISAGALSVGNGGTAGTLGAGRVTNNSSLFLNRSDSFTVSNSISGTGILTKLGAGTVTLLGTNTHSGDTRNYAGAISLGNNSALGSGTLEMGDGVNGNISGAILSSDVTSRTISNAVDLRNSATFGSVTTGDLLFTGNVNAGTSSKTFTINNTKIL